MTATGVDHDTGSSDDVDNSSDSDIPDTDVTDSTTIVACIPNFEIQCMFRQLLRNHIHRHMKSDTRIRSVTLFRDMVSGEMASFAEGFAKLIWESMPAQLLGGKEFVYQAYVCAFFTAASEAAIDLRYSSAWEIQVERCAGIGRLDFILQRMGDDTGVIQEHKREKLTKKDKRDGYGDSQSKRLTKMVAKGLQQLETKQYRASMRDHVTKLHEYSLGFLGPYCAIAGRSLKREPGGQWVIVNSYDAAQNEKQRALLYRSKSS